MKEYFKRYKAMSGKFRGKDIVTVCTILDDKEKRGRGVAVCSPTDIPDEKSGEFWARCYAERAIKRRPDVPITDYRAIRTVLHTDCPFIMQSEMHPVLTFQEKAFFFGKKNVNADKIYSSKLIGISGGLELFASGFRDPNPLI